MKLKVKCDWNDPRDMDITTLRFVSDEIGEIELEVDFEDALNFEVGKEYYLEITEVEE